jgi:hypothetical protein
MQKQGRILRTDRKNPAEGTGTHGRFKRRKRSQADKTAGGRPTAHFLNRVFRPQPAVRFHPLFNRKNYDCLYASAKNYAGLSGSHFDFQASKPDFPGLLCYMESLLPPHQHVLLEEEAGQLSFRVWFGTDFLIGEVFFIPIGILDRTEGRLRDILLAFFQLFRQAHGFPAKDDLFDYEMIVEEYETWQDPDDDPERWNYIQAYKSGYIHDTFSLIYRKPGRSIEELEQLITGYTARNEAESRLFGSIRTGLNLMLTGKSIFDYVRRPAEGDDNFYDPDEEYMIEAERMLRFIYSGSDFVSECYMEYLNTESGDCSNEYFPRNSIVLTPETDRLLEVDFVECFFTWLAEFISNLYDYEERKCE